MQNLKEKNNYLNFYFLVDKIDGKVATYDTYNFHSRFEVRGNATGPHNALALGLADYCL